MSIDPKTTYRCYRVDEDLSRHLIHCDDLCHDAEFSMYMRDIGLLLIFLSFCVMSRPIVIWCIQSCKRHRRTGNSMVEEVHNPNELTSNQEVQCDLEMPVCRVVIHPDESLTLMDTD